MLALHDFLATHPRSSRIVVFATWPGALLLLLMIASGALLFALTAQYVFGYAPCTLCLWQRVPYALLLPLAAAGLWLPALRRWRGAILLCCGLLLLIGAGIAFYHNGVEQHWWAGTASCGIQGAGGAAESAASLRARLLATPVARCDMISWQFLGLSMTAWNLLLTLGAALYALVITLCGRTDATPTEK